MSYVERRNDGSYVVDRGGMPYHVPPESPEYAREYAMLAARYPDLAPGMSLGEMPEAWRREEPPEPAPASLGIAVQRQLGLINEKYEQAMAYVQAGYPLTEVLSWERQATQARELMADPQAEAAFVRTLAAAKGVDVEEMTRRILANAASWEPVAAMLTAQRQILEDRVLAAASVSEALAVAPSYSV